jgi:NitT/TauT family transport system permease protein
MKHDGLQIVVPLAALAAWELTSRMFRLDTLLPAPTAILAEIFVKARLLSQHGLETVNAVLLGLGASAVLGVLLGALLASTRWLSAAVLPLLVASQTVPKVAIAPLLMIWFGFGIESKVLIAFLMAFFPVLIDTMVGLQAVPAELILLARSMGARRIGVFLRFELPYASPYIFGGLRVAAVFAVAGVVVAEFVGTERGLMYLLAVAQGQHQSALVFGVVVILSVLSLLLFAGVELLERLLIPWYARARRSSL